jgi:hypothetical protein
VKIGLRSEAAAAGVRGVAPSAGRSGDCRRRARRRPRPGCPSPGTSARTPRHDSRCTRRSTGRCGDAAVRKRSRQQRWRIAGRRAFAARGAAASHESTTPPRARRRPSRQRTNSPFAALRECRRRSGRGRAGCGDAARCGSTSMPPRHPARQRPRCTPRSRARSDRAIPARGRSPRAVRLSATAASRASS